MAEVAQVYKPGEEVTYTTAAAIAAGTCVFLSAAGANGYSGVGNAGSVSPTTGDTDLCMGVAAFDAPSGGKVTVVRGGIIECLASGALAFGVPVKAAASGRVTTFTPGTDTEGKRLGYTMTASSTAGDPIRVFWTR